jgi:uncharacterized membrane protein YphA (DoxX/SURF4 family)
VRQHRLADPRHRDVVGLLARVVLGGVVLVAGLLKVAHLESSARAVRAYQLLPYDVAGYLGYALPVLEVAVGILLVVGLFTRGSAVIGGFLMVVFIIGISSAWARGLSIDCGCFGKGGTIAAAQTQYPQEIARDVGLLLCAAWLVVRPRSALSLERHLFPDRDAPDADAPQPDGLDPHSLDPSHERPHA